MAKFTIEREMLIPWRAVYVVEAENVAEAIMAADAADLEAQEGTTGGTWAPDDECLGGESYVSRIWAGEPELGRVGEHDPESLYVPLDQGRFRVTDPLLHDLLADASSKAGWTDEALGAWFSKWQDELRLALGMRKKALGETLYNPRGIAADLHRAVAVFLDIHDSVPEEGATTQDSHSVGWALDGLRDVFRHPVASTILPNARDAIRDFLTALDGSLAGTVPDHVLQYEIEQLRKAVAP